MSGDHNMNQKSDAPDWDSYKQGWEDGVMQISVVIAQSLNKQADLAVDVLDRQWALEMAKAVRQRKPIPHPPAPTYCTTEEERKSWVLGWLECEAAHKIKE
jgi:hypothetical protein